MFIKGNIKFEVDYHTFEFLQQDISTFGVTGLPWGSLSPEDHFARTVTVRMIIPYPATVLLDKTRNSPAPDPLAIKTKATLMRERTIHGEQMGLRFDLDAEQAAALGNFIATYGHYPTRYVRKYPRIPSLDIVQTYPLRVNVFVENEEPIVMDVGNMSPNGILLVTESQAASVIMPGKRLNLILEPRGPFPLKIRIEGLVCRVTDDRVAKTGNVAHYFGLKFTKIEHSDRAAFQDLFKDILEKMKILNLVGG